MLADGHPRTLLMALAQTHSYPVTGFAQLEPVNATYLPQTVLGISNLMASRHRRGGDSQGRIRQNRTDEAGSSMPRCRGLIARFQPPALYLRAAEFSVTKSHPAREQRQLSESREEPRAGNKRGQGQALCAWGRAVTVKEFCCLISQAGLIPPLGRDLV